MNTPLQYHQYKLNIQRILNWCLKWCNLYGAPCTRVREKKQRQNIQNLTSFDFTKIFILQMFFIWFSGNFLSVLRVRIMCNVFIKVRNIDKSRSCKVGYFFNEFANFGVQHATNWTQLQENQSSWRKDLTLKGQPLSMFLTLTNHWKL